MIQNYLKIALRNLSKHRAFSFLNIFGLAISMSVCLLLIMLIKDAYSFDRFHPEGARIYRLLTEAQRKDGHSESYATSPFPAGQSLRENYALTELWTPIVRMGGDELISDEKTFNFDGLYADPGFFDMFGFELEHGNVLESLESPYSIVLTKELAVSMFPNENPMGKILEINNFGQPFRVTGVLKAFPGKTHFEFNILASLATQLAEEKRPERRQVSTNWVNYYSTFNFVRLAPGANRSAAEQALANIAQNQYANLELESRDAGYRFTLQPLAEITPGVDLSNTMGAGMPIFLIWFLGILGSAIMLSACFNYTNLTIARALTRAREVGVRKVLGANRMQVFGQLVGEAVVTSVLALGAAYLMMKLLKPQFERLSITESLDVRIQEDWQLFAIFLTFAIGVGVLAGLLPALTLSKTKPIAVLQRLQNIRFMQRLGLRKMLLTVQFTLTLIFLITMTIAWRQSEHAISVNFGFDQTQTVLVQLQGQPFDRISSALGQVAGVEELSGISIPMGTWRDYGDDVRTDSVPEKTGVRQYFVDHQYLPQFDLPLAAGENFPTNPAQQQEVFAVVNETFVQRFKLGEPQSAIGKGLLVGDSLRLIVRGVVKDFPFKPAIYKMEPLLLRYNPEELGVLNLRLAAGNAPATFQKLENEWKRLVPNTPFQAEFFDETARSNFSEAMDLVRIVGFFGLMGMIIACMGLLGMAIYTVETKAKEISIRKVMGANARDLSYLLSKGYLWLLGISILISTPVTYFIGSKMLDAFSSRIPMSPWLFLPGILLLLLAAGLAVGSQTFRALRSNPVDQLRSE
ncbi:MAG: ABC transporter permease [Saprospiraceae bacterium]